MEKNEADDDDDDPHERFNKTEGKGNSGDADVDGDNDNGMYEAAVDVTSVSQEEFVVHVLENNLGEFWPHPESEWFCRCCNYEEFKTSEELDVHMKSIEHEIHERHYEDSFCLACQIHTLNSCGMKWHGQTDHHKKLSVIMSSSIAFAESFWKSNNEVRVQKDHKKMKVISGGNKDDKDNKELSVDIAARKKLYEALVLRLTNFEEDGLLKARGCFICSTRFKEGSSWKAIYTHRKSHPHLGRMTKIRNYAIVSKTFHLFDKFYEGYTPDFDVSDFSLNDDLDTRPFLTETKCLLCCLMINSLEEWDTHANMKTHRDKEKDWRSLVTSKKDYKYTELIPDQDVETFLHQVDEDTTSIKDLFGEDRFVKWSGCLICGCVFKQKDSWKLLYYHRTSTQHRYNVLWALNDERFRTNLQQKTWLEISTFDISVVYDTEPYMLEGRCVLCDKQFNDTSEWNVHLQGKQHRRNVCTYQASLYKMVTTERDEFHRVLTTKTARVLDSKIHPDFLEDDVVKMHGCLLCKVKFLNPGSPKSMYLHRITNKHQQNVERSLKCSTTTNATSVHDSFKIDVLSDVRPFISITGCDMCKVNLATVREYDAHIYSLAHMRNICEVAGRRKNTTCLLCTSILPKNNPSQHLASNHKAHMDEICKGSKTKETNFLTKSERRKLKRIELAKINPESQPQKRQKVELPMYSIIQPPFETYQSNRDNFITPGYSIGTGSFSSTFNQSSGDMNVNAGSGQGMSSLYDYSPRRYFSN